MFQPIEPPQPDGILQLSIDFRADPRPSKLDLGVGVYRDEKGQTPIMRAVTKAEETLLRTRTSKSYLGLLGDVAYNKALAELILAEQAGSDRASAIQTPGGCGALRLGFDLIASVAPEATVWVPDPTWANHIPTLKQAGLRHRTYPYLNHEGKGVEFEAMADGLRKVPAGDVVLLHGCCHNPSGADLSPEQWDEVTRIALQAGFLPMVDLAYLGFGDGLEADAYGVNTLFAQVPEMLVAASCSKNFGIYNERTGLLLALSEDADSAFRTLGRLKFLARTNHSMPPDHGAAIVSTILQDHDLRSDWQGELEAMRRRIKDLREQLAQQFRERTNTSRFDFLAVNKGMFSLLGMTPEQVARLRADHGIYMPANSRINIAGMQQDDIDMLVDAACAVLGE